MSDLVATVIVRFNPPPGFDARVAMAAAQSDMTIVVDNGSTRPWTPDPQVLAARHDVHYLRNEENLGIATALNQGIRYAALHGAGSAFLLDHDSDPLAGCVQRLLQTLHTNTRHPVAAVVPHILYGHPDIQCRWPSTAGSGRRLRFRFVYAERMQGTKPVDLAISSGMLVSIAHWQRLGGFDENLFIDLVDTDYCLRARRNGLLVLAEPRAWLQHTLGDVQKRAFFGRFAAFPTHHSTIRHYYISRNRMALYRRHGLRFPSWAAYETLGALKLIMKVVAFEDGRRQKLAATVRGTLDGMRGRRGPRR